MTGFAATMAAAVVAAAVAAASAAAVAACHGCGHGCEASHCARKKYHADLDILLYWLYQGILFSFFQKFSS